MDTQDQYIAWEAMEYADRERSTDWYWAVAIIAFCASIASVIYKNYLFAIFIMLAVLILFYLARRPAKLVHYEIIPKGLVVDGYLHPWGKLHSYWVDETGDEHKLLVVSERYMMPLMIIPLPDTHSEHVRNICKVHIEEKHIEEPVSHRLMKHLGF